MFFDPLEIPDELLAAQEEGTLVVFAGAGVSMGDPSNLPDFKGLAAHIAETHPLAAEIAKYDTRLDRFLGELGRNGVRVQELCRQRIGDEASRPTELHRSIVGLFPKSEDLRIVTTNFDLHFLKVFEERGLKPDCYCAPALPLGDEFSGLVYLHGSIYRPEPLVLTDEDFGRAYLTEGWAREFLQRLFAKFTTLFVGYSHGDLPVEYLARGMSGTSVAPRFALTPRGEAGQWASLGITEIGFDKSEGGNPFEHLYAGVRKWAGFTKQQPTEIAERVKQIVCAPEFFRPDKAQAGVLNRCLERDDQCHFFTSWAKGWHWVKWLDEQGILTPLFDPARTDVTLPQRRLGSWLAEALVAEQSENGLLLVASHRGVLGRHLWTALRRELCSSDRKFEWTSPLAQRWVLLLVETAPEDSAAEFTSLLGKASLAPSTLGMVLLRRLTQPRFSLVGELGYPSLAPDRDTAACEDLAGFEIQIIGETSGLSDAWEAGLNRLCATHGESLLLLFEDRLREIHDLYRAAKPNDDSNEPFCHRQRIIDRETYPTGHTASVILDFLLDVLEALAKQPDKLPEQRVLGWLRSEVPVLVRVGLYALHLSKDIPNARKVQLLQESALVYPKVSNATHEAWQVLIAGYAALDVPARESVWKSVQEGPSHARPSGVLPQAWEQWRQHQIDALTSRLASTHEACPLAATALKGLHEQTPGDRSSEPTRHARLGGGGGASDDSRSPRSGATLVSQPPSSQIDFLLEYKGGVDPFEESREGLLAAVGDACGQNPAWAVDLLVELDSRKQWESDLWNAAFWRIKLSSLPSKQLTWLLSVLGTHFTAFQPLQGLSYFLFSSVDLSEGQRPSPENLKLLIQISLSIWTELRAAEPSTNTGFRKEKWAELALNHPAGRIAEFWLKCCALDQDLSDPKVPGFPGWLTGPLADMLEGADYASQLGRAILGLNLAWVYQVDPSWVRARLLPKLHFSNVGEEAFLLWEPHAGHGLLSRELVLLMPELYREAFPRFLDVDASLRVGFFRHIVGIVCSGVFDVNESSWLRDFLLGLDDRLRAAWAGEMERQLRATRPELRTKLWRTWMNHYWTERTNGRPMRIGEKEAEEMLDWPFVVEDGFPEAVNLVVQGPVTVWKVGRAVGLLKTHPAPEKYPEAVVKLLSWYFKGGSRVPLDFEVLKAVLFRLPRRRALLPALEKLCERLLSSAYVGAVDLKKRIQREFTEE